MKFFFALFMILTVACFAQTQKTEFSSNCTLQQVSERADIPIKKIMQMLELHDPTNPQQTLAELQISADHLEKALEQYQISKKSYYSGIVLVGMSIVFLSLIIVGFGIHSLQHIGQKKTVHTRIGAITAAPEHISSNAIVAVITAIHLHEADVEEKNRLLLTWKRSQLSMWSAANLVESRFIGNRRT